MPAGASVESPGTTSAHAENTVMAMALVYIAGNYLRARGEYMPRRVLTTWLMELPPRTRRIREHTATGERQMGTTSAHAENTEPSQIFLGFGGNYLRARGEYR